MTQPALHSAGFVAVMRLRERKWQSPVEAVTLRRGFARSHGAGGTRENQNESPVTVGRKLFVLWMFCRAGLTKGLDGRSAACYHSLPPLIRAFKTKLTGDAQVVEHWKRCPFSFY
jgi:hypothetical protein